MALCIGYLWYAHVYTLPKLEYNHLHPYTSWIPITGDSVNVYSSCASPARFPCAKCLFKARWILFNSFSTHLLQCTSCCGIQHHLYGFGAWVCTDGLAALPWRLVRLHSQLRIASVLMCQLAGHRHRLVLILLAACKLQVSSMSYIMRSLQTWPCIWTSWTYNCGQRRYNCMPRRFAWRVGLPKRNVINSVKVHHCTVIVRIQSGDSSQYMLLQLWSMACI